ncbi:hypothetical protein BpHYR1_036286 [Brachionus plicatilis]|uniref:Uncharacterized protein n=1 Tax=Brachionus plicatilis TaxID=10195 RepID=A0A3M7RRQ4_BRAPC|nr:hypothetical protein BpHYR1_036286 [Brachionus plicatilis]
MKFSKKKGLVNIIVAALINKVHISEFLLDILNLNLKLSGLAENVNRSSPKNVTMMILKVIAKYYQPGTIQSDFDKLCNDAVGDLEHDHELLLGFCEIKNKRTEQSFKINHVNAEWCSSIHCVNSKSLLMMCKISAKCTSLDYIEI